MYSSTLPATSALDGFGWSTPRPGRFTPGKENRYPFCRRLGVPQDQSEQMQKISPRPGLDPLTVQPVASLYTDWAIPARASILYRSIIGRKRLYSACSPSNCATVCRCLKRTPRVSSLSAWRRVWVSRLFVRSGIPNILRRRREK